MKLSEWKIKLKDITIQPFDQVTKVKSLDDVMYLYYTLQFTNDKGRKIKFNAYDFPVIQHIRCMVKKYGEISSPFGLEHSVRVDKLLKGKVNIHIFEHFGNSVMLDLLSKKEVKKFVEYIEMRIENSFKRYNEGKMYKN